MNAEQTEKLCVQYSIPVITFANIYTTLRDVENKVKLPMYPIQFYKQVLQSLGFGMLEMEGEEINGWQIEFTYTFIHPDKGEYQLAGSLHYGDFKFTKI